MNAVRTFREVPHERGKLLTPILPIRVFAGLQYPYCWSVLQFDLNQCFLYDAMLARRKMDA